MSRKNVTYLFMDFRRNAPQILQMRENLTNREITQKNILKELVRFVALKGKVSKVIFIYARSYKFIRHEI